MNRSRMSIIALTVALSVLLTVANASFLGATAMGGAREYNAAYKRSYDSYASASYDYDDSYFEQPSTVLNPKLAEASIALSAAAYKDWSVDNALRSMDFKAIEPEYQETNVDDNDTAAATIAYRSIALEGEKVDLFVFVVRGTTGYEWVSNFNVGDGYVHAGFNLAMQNLLAKFRSYYNSHLEKKLFDDDISNNKLWITGHSRGAAVANLLAAYFGGSGDFFTPDNIYAYNFACPNVISSNIKQENFSYIFNFNNSADFICSVPLDGWNYKRYGITLTLNQMTGLSEIMEDEFYAATGVAYEGMTPQDTEKLVALIEELAPSVEAYYATDSFVPAKMRWFARSPSQLFRAIGISMGGGFGLESIVTIPPAIGQVSSNITLSVKIVRSFLTHSKEINTTHCLDAYLAWIKALSRSAEPSLETKIVDTAVTPPAVIETLNIQYETDDLAVDIEYPQLSALADPLLEQQLNNQLATLAKDVELEGVEAKEDSFGPCYASMSFEIERNDERILSIYMDVYSELGGAHGSESIICLNVLNTSKGRVLSLADLFEPDFDYVGYLDAGIAEQIAADEELVWEGDITTIGQERPFYLTGSELVVVFQADETGAYAEGALEFSFPLDIEATEIRVLIDAPVVASTEEERSTYTDGDYRYTLLADGAAEIILYTGEQKALTVPDTLGGYQVTAIGDYDFYECELLESITIPDSVTAIGDYAFSFCGSLTSITIPDSVTAIGDSAFYSCRSLTSITIPDSVTVIGDSAFNNCDSLTSITIPDSVTAIGNEAFYGCDSLTSITIPDSVTAIGDFAFSWCNSLTSITIPNSVINIGRNPFGGCWMLTAIQVSPDHPTLATIDGVLFEKTEKRLVVYPRSFEDSSYTIPNGIRLIGGSAFSYCESLTSITIPDSVTAIGNEAFYGCDSLTSITIPDSVTSIGDNPFIDCYGLTAIQVSPDHPTLATIDGVLFEKTEKRLVAYPCSFEDSSYTIPNGIRLIGGSAFSECNSLTSITIPDSVTAIGDSAFNNCQSLTSITIPGSVTVIGDEAFNRCELLESITIPDSITAISKDAFYGCRSLTSITIPDSVTSIGKGAFYECNSLTSITIPDSVTAIGDFTFSYCRTLTSITISDSITAIGDSAFCYCSSLTNITIPDSVTYICRRAFDGCESLTLTVGRDSYAKAYADENNIPYTYSDANDWLNG